MVRSKTEMKMEMKMKTQMDGKDAKRSAKS